MFLPTAGALFFGLSPGRYTSPMMSFARDRPRAAPLFAAKSPVEQRLRELGPTGCIRRTFVPALPLLGTSRHFAALRNLVAIEA